MMDVTLSALSLLIVSTMPLALGLAVLLAFADWGNRRANGYLSLLMLAWLTMALSSVLINEGVIRPYLYFSYALGMTNGPLMLLYTRSITRSAQPLARLDWLHFVPVLLMLLLWAVQVSMAGVAWNDASCTLSHECALYDRQRTLHRLLFYVFSAFYIVWCIRLLAPHLARLKAQYSSLDGVNLLWLHWLLRLFLLLAVLGFGFEVLRANAYFPTLNTRSITAMSPFFLTLGLAVLALLQQRIPLSDEGEQAATLASVQPAAKYQTSRLTPADAEQLWQALEQLMQAEKPYLQNGLKLSQLSGQLAVPSNHLSETINGHARQSFYEYINSYRVQAAASMLEQPRYANLSVTDIAYQAGFNAQSSFFNHFKARFGLTPNQYRKKHKKVTD